MRESSLRIALLTHSVNPRGGVVHTLELGGALQAAGHEVTIMAPVAGRQLLFRRSSCTLDLFGVDASPSTATDLIRARIVGYVHHLTTPRDSKPRYAGFDVLHAQDGIGGNALTMLTKTGLIPGFVRTVHHVEQHSEQVINAWEDRAIRGARQLCCVSRHWQGKLRRKYGLSSALVTNGVDLARYTSQTQPADPGVAERFGLRPGAPLVVSIGGVEERKNTLQILRAFLLLRRRMPHAQWVIVGGASLLDHSRYRQEFDALVSSSGLVEAPGGDLVRTGVVEDAVMPALLRLADAVAFPSLREGFGLVVLEALACGTPTVVANIAPFTEYLDADVVHWADPHEATSIEEALAAAIATPPFAPPAVCREFSWQASAVRHVEIYRSLMRTDSSTLH